MTRNKNHKDLLEKQLFSAEVISNILLYMFKNTKHDPCAIVREFFNIHSKKYGGYIGTSYHADYYADSRLRYECDFYTTAAHCDMRDAINSYLLAQVNNNAYMFDVSYDDNAKTKTKTIPILSYHIVDEEAFYVLNIDEQTEEYTNVDKISARLKAEKINSCIWDTGTSNLPPPKLDGIMWDEEY